MTDRNLGFNACAHEIGITLFEKYKDRAVFGSQETKKGLKCFLGLAPLGALPEHLRLTNSEDWEYYCACTVKDGAVTINETKIP